MMLDADIVAVSPSSVWRVLGQAGLLTKWNGKPSKKGTGFEQPLQAASTLAYRRFLHQHQRHVLLPVQRAGRLQPVHRALGFARVDDGGRHRDHSARSQGEIPGSEAADHLRQRSAVHRAGLQGVHSDLGHDARENVAVLSAIQRQDRALAQIAQRRMHPAGNAADAGRRAAPDSGSTWTTTTPCGCTAPSATLRRRTCWRGGRRRSTRRATANWKKRASSGRKRRQQSSVRGELQ